MNFLQKILSTGNKNLSLVGKRNQIYVHFFTPEPNPQV